MNGKLLISHSSTNPRLCFLTDAPDDDASSDDEPLTEVAKKLKSQRQAKSPRKANLVTKSKRNAGRKKGKCENV